MDDNRNGWAWGCLFLGVVIFLLMGFAGCWWWVKMVQPFQIQIPRND